MIRLAFLFIFTTFAVFAGGEGIAPDGRPINTDTGTLNCSAIVKGYYRDGDTTKHETPWAFLGKVKLSSECQTRAIDFLDGGIDPRIGPFDSFAKAYWVLHLEDATTAEGVVNYHDILDYRLAQEKQQAIDDAEARRVEMSKIR